MPVGKQFVRSVEAVLTDEPASALTIGARLAGAHSGRAVRYALAALVKTGKAKRKGFRGCYVSYTKEAK